MPINDSTQRFSSRVENYVRYRPGYPSEILDVLKRECGLTADSIIADVGCGTGFLAKVFLEYGARVFGIEPNKEMREAGERFLEDCPKFMSLTGTAEDTSLPEHSVDFVTAGQAAHWFDRQRARREFRRVLKPGGWTVLVWNDRATDSTVFLREYEQLLQTYGVDYHEVRRVDMEMGSAIASFFDPNPVSTKTFPNRQEFDFGGLQGRLLSSSYSPQEGHANYEPMMAALRRLFEASQRGGIVQFDYETHMYYGQLG
ncbi:MAG TPA: class I SAM-dependent methyltransferase [Terriglobales bacterium]|nr:class I SAM-dependent methyltransferase [Terriglobales bacterium]